MSGAWISRRQTASGVRYRVRYRLGGRESASLYAGSFRTMREAKARRDWIVGEFAAMRVPNMTLLVETEPAPTLRVMSERWRASRVDVAEGTKVLHRVALGRVLPILGDRRVDEITPADVAHVVEALAGDGKKRETIRKSTTALAMVLDFAGVSPNPARDRIQVRLPRAEPETMEPPTASQVEDVCWRLSIDYMVATLALDVTGARVGELEQARVGDLDEERRAWLVRAGVAKTRRPRWVELPDDLYEVIVERLPPREDRDPTAPLLGGWTAERLRTAIARACRDAGVPQFSPHDLRHRRISLLHRHGISWAEIGERMGQRSKLVTADIYSHALLQTREVDREKLLERVRGAQIVRPPVRPQAL